MLGTHDIVRTCLKSATAYRPVAMATASLGAQPICDARPLLTPKWAPIDRPKTPRSTSGALLLRGLQLFEFALPLHFGGERLAFLRLHEDGFFFARVCAGDDILHVA